MEGNTKKIGCVLEFLLHCITNYRVNQQEYGDFFNYEDFAKEQFKKKGRGFVCINATKFVKNYFNNETRLTGVDYNYCLFDESKDWAPPIYEKLKATSQYDASKYYAVVILARTSELPKSFTAGVSGNVVLVSQVALTQALTPSKITTSQIRKRLKRMVQQGVQVLVLDTKEPDCMGANLVKWITSIKALEEEGKSFSIVIDGDENSLALIPAQFKKDVRTLTLK